MSLQQSTPLTLSQYQNCLQKHLKTIHLFELESQQGELTAVAPTRPKLVIKDILNQAILFTDMHTLALLEMDMEFLEFMIYGLSGCLKSLPLIYSCQTFHKKRGQMKKKNVQKQPENMIFFSFLPQSKGRELMFPYILWSGADAQLKGCSVLAWTSKEAGCFRSMVIKKDI